MPSTPNEIKNCNYIRVEQASIFLNCVQQSKQYVLANIAPSSNLVTSSYIARFSKFSTMYVVNETQDSLFKKVTSSQLIDTKIALGISTSF
jgi:hypothetical protein